jgi:hypothetical protein
MLRLAWFLGPQARQSLDVTGLKAANWYLEDIWGAGAA